MKDMTFKGSAQGVMFESSLQLSYALFIATSVASDICVFSAALLRSLHRNFNCLFCMFHTHPYRVLSVFCSPCLLHFFQACQVFAADCHV